MLILSALRTLEYDKNSIKSCIMSSALSKLSGKGYANLSLYPSVHEKEFTQIIMTCHLILYFHAIKSPVIYDMIIIVYDSICIFLNYHCIITFIDIAFLQY